MLVVFPICHKDYVQACSQLMWCQELQPNYSGHSALLVFSNPIGVAEMERALKIATNCKFDSVVSIHQSTPDESGWPGSCNSMFRVAVEFIESRKREPFFWCEPDCIPLRQNWLSEIQSEYVSSGKLFMGAVWNKPVRHLTGCAVYPANLRHRNPYMLNGSDRPFDVVRPDLTLRSVHNTALVHHEWGDIASNTPWTFPNLDSLNRIRTRAAVFHRCKDGSLIGRLTEQKNDGIKNPEYVDSPGTAERISQWINVKVRKMLRGFSSYYHSGNLGDIVYALNAIQIHGGGNLLIGPIQMGTSPCAVPINREQYNMLEPLLAHQSYIKNSSFTDKYPAGKIVFDLNTFRNHWNNWPLRSRLNIHSLAQMHAYALGVMHLFNEKVLWINVPNPIRTGRIIVHRSSRYNSADFPWKSIVHNFGSRMLFVGNEHEHRDFIKKFGKVSYWRVTDFLELARLIAGGVAFVGNQSFPCSVALGCGQNVFQESWTPSPDCMFARPNFATQHDGIEKLERFINA